jgi:putative transposase
LDEGSAKRDKDFAIKEYKTGLETCEKRYDFLVEREKFIKEKNPEYKMKTIKKPTVKFRKKKDNQSITINKDAIHIEKGQVYMYKKSFDESPLLFKKRAYKKDKKLKSLLNGSIYHDIKIQKNRLNKYYICYTIDVNKNKLNINENNVVACDTGGRTFITTYSEREVLEIGKEINKQIYKINEILDLKKQILYIISKVKNKIKNKRFMSKNILKDNIKLRNMIDDLHYKAITKLMEYDLIYIPKLDVKSIIEKDNLPKKAKRELQLLSHSLFLQRLLNKAEILGKKVIICSEDLTTKICGKCFNKNEVNDKKEYKCEVCGIKIDRDINAARNILIKQIKSIE